MFETRLHIAFWATEMVRQASVEGMLPPSRSEIRYDCGSSRTIPGTVIASRFSLAVSAVFIALFFLLAPRANALAEQSNVDTGLQPAATHAPLAFTTSLQPALEQVGASIGQIQIDRWKLPREWKSQLHNDASSIQQDLSHQLPALIEQAQASPAALDAQMRVMQNVNALYDVLVRLTMAANLTEKKQDAAMLDGALQQLEAARKTASDELLRGISQQNRQILHLQSQLVENQAAEHPSASPSKTIIVDNGATRHRPRHRSVHRNKPSPTPPTTKPGQSGAHAPQTNATNQK